MHNAEKYISVCLDSILIQTFQDFEVIVVDDCSTDNSPAIVESYLEKFGGRLTLLRMRKRFSGPSAPTNKGISHARGKYIWAVDNDDVLLNIALEQIYNAAETFEADVVHMNKEVTFMNDPKNPLPSLEKISVPSNFNSKISLDPSDVGERIKIFCEGGTLLAGWRKFVRRDFLVENAIFFPEDLKISQDVYWTIKLICLAKRYLRITYPLYLYRYRPDSLLHTPRSDKDTIKLRGRTFAKGVEFLFKFFSEQEFFQKKPEYVWMLLNRIEEIYFKYVGRALLQVPPQEAQKILAESFVADFGEHSGLLAYLYTSANVSRLKMNLLAARVAELERRLKNSSQ